MYAYLRKDKIYELSELKFVHFSKHSILKQNLLIIPVRRVILFKNSAKIDVLISKNTMVMVIIVVIVFSLHFLYGACACT